MSVSEAKEGPAGSSFLGRLSELPFVQVSRDLYVQSKERHRLLGRGLDALEYGVNRATPAVSTLVARVPGSSSLDNLACSYLEKLETKYAVLQEPPEEVLRSVACSAGSAMAASVRQAMTRFPGRHMVRTLDGVLSWSENALDRMHGNLANPPQTDDDDDDDDDQEERAQAPEQSKQAGVLLTIGVLTPLEFYVSVLRSVKRLLARAAGLDTRPRSSSSGEIVRRTSITRRQNNIKVLLRFLATLREYLGLPKRAVSALEPASASSERRTASEPYGDQAVEDNQNRSLDLEEALKRYQADTQQGDFETEEGLPVRYSTPGTSPNQGGSCPHTAAPLSPDTSPVT